MRTISFGGLAIVAAAALAAPLALGLFPRIRLPAIVLEIVLGIVIGPQAVRSSVDGSTSRPPTRIVGEPRKRIC